MRSDDGQSSCLGEDTGRSTYLGWDGYGWWPKNEAMRCSPSQSTGFRPPSRAKCVWIIISGFLLTCYQSHEEKCWRELRGSEAFCGAAGSSMVSPFQCRGVEGDQPSPAATPSDQFVEELQDQLPLRSVELAIKSTYCWDIPLYPAAPRICSQQHILCFIYLFS